MRILYITAWLLLDSALCTAEEAKEAMVMKKIVSDIEAIIIKDLAELVLTKAQKTVTKIYEKNLADEQNYNPYLQITLQKFQDCCKQIHLRLEEVRKFTLRSPQGSPIDDRPLKGYVVDIIRMGSVLAEILQNAASTSLFKNLGPEHAKLFESKSKVMSNMAETLKSLPYSSFANKSKYIYKGFVEDNEWYYGVMNRWENNMGQAFATASQSTKLNVNVSSQPSTLACFFAIDSLIDLYNLYTPNIRKWSNFQNLSR